VCPIHGKASTIELGAGASREDRLGRALRDHEIGAFGRADDDRHDAPLEVEGDLVDLRKLGDARVRLAVLCDRGHHKIAGDGGEVGRHAQPKLLQMESVQEFAAPRVGQLEQRSILAMQEVEHDVLHRHPPDQLRARCRDVHAMLQQTEVRATVVVDADGLPDKTAFLDLEDIPHAV